jgi:hypothetical protein
VTGPTGRTGFTGPPGTIGASGPTGATGIAGPTGFGIIAGTGAAAGNLQLGNIIINWGHGSISPPGASFAYNTPYVSDAPFPTVGWGLTGSITDGFPQFQLVTTKTVLAINITGASGGVWFQAIGS